MTLTLVLLALHVYAALAGDPAPVAEVVHIQAQLDAWRSDAGGGPRPRPAKDCSRPQNVRVTISSISID
jgi:hypothetical protein